jgi:hypothetical protein
MSKKESKQIWLRLKDFKLPRKRKRWLTREWVSDFFLFLEEKGLYYETPKKGLTVGGWEKWTNNVKSSYPVRYFIRETLEDFEYYYWLKWVHKIRRAFRIIFKPAFPIVRKAVPRQHMDYAELLVNLNFAVIEQFKLVADRNEKNWQEDPNSLAFKAWLDESFIWIKEGRKNLHTAIGHVYDRVMDIPPGPHTWEQRKELYAEIDRIEKLIADTDSNIVRQMLDYKNQFYI